ncbi:MAG: ATPase [Prevotellaceae bacterium]|jgi:N-acetylglucosamine kinase-like BadF-type ATPase|nr:ATPase [Prevotellaceae bacterium]
MILIADSGSTKTHWCIVDGVGIKTELFTEGINPFFQSEDEIAGQLNIHLLPKLTDFPIDEIHYYGAGCAFAAQKQLLRNAFNAHFSDASIHVESDLTAAARSLFNKRQGIACILGTGSNSCLYDGEKIVANISPLGFILGDEGSAAVLGRQLVADCLKNQLPDGLRGKFLEKFHLTPQLILDKVYKNPFPNRFLAGLSVFLKENIEYQAMYDIVYGGFKSFFIRNVMQYPLEGEKIGFVGSTAYHYRDILEKVAVDLGLSIDRIVQNPMQGLVKYHV